MTIVLSIVGAAFVMLVGCLLMYAAAGFRARQRQFDEWQRQFGLAEACRRTAATAKTEYARRKYTELAARVDALH